MGIAKLSAVGIGMRSHCGVAATMFKALGAAGVNIGMISTSEIKIAVTVDETRIEDAARAVHDAFGLDKPPALLAQEIRGGGDLANEVMVVDGDCFLP